MKKYFILAASALIALAACTKTQVNPESNAISFQVANYVETKANVAFSNEDFGAYCWYTTDEGTTPYFSDEKVAKVGSEWRTVNATYYWHKTGYMDFICYSPYQEGAPAVTESSIAWGKGSGEAALYEVKMDNKDLMYADKAVKQTANTSTYTALSGTNGVPTLFHHALAKLSFKVKATFLTYTQEEVKDEEGNVLVESSTTDWEVTLKSAKLTGIYNKGKLELTLGSDNKWVLPKTTVGSDKFNVWTSPAGALDAVELVTVEDGVELTTTAQDLYVGKDGKAQSFYVLPQVLKAAAQKIYLEFDIKTTLPSLDENGERRVIEETYAKTLDLSEFSSLKAWQMNENIVYTICIKPTAVNDPANGDDPTDVIITFDPAQADWKTIDTDAIIQI